MLLQNLPQKQLGGIASSVQENISSIRRQSGEDLV